MNDIKGEVLEQKKLFKGIVFDVDELKIELTESTFGQIKGQTTITRQLVTKNPVVVAMVKNIETDRFILTKEFRVGAMRDEYGFVAGIIDEGETPWDAVIRELKEETGYKPTMVKQIGESYSSSGFTNEHVSLFYIEVSNSGRGHQKLDKDEIIHVEEMSFSKIIELVKDGQISSNHAKACILHHVYSK